MASNINAIVTDSLTKKITGYNLFNYNALSLFSIPYRSSFPEGGGADIPLDRMLLKVKNLDAFRKPPVLTIEQESAWYLKHTYCYGIKVPPSQADELNVVISQDLDRLFQVDSRIETRSVKCIILKRISGDDKIRTKHAGSAQFSTDTITHMETIHDVSFKGLVSLIRRDLNVLQLDFTPFLDETNYKGNIDIILPQYDDKMSGRENADRVLTIPELRQALRKYGLDLVEEYRERKMLVIRDKPTS
jgi:hypothetical protein